MERNKISSAADKLRSPKRTRFIMCHSRRLCNYWKEYFHQYTKYRLSVDCAGEPDNEDCSLAWLVHRAGQPGPLQGGGVHRPDIPRSECIFLSYYFYLGIQNVRCINTLCRTVNVKFWRKFILNINIVYPNILYIGFLLFICVIQHCFICRPSESSVSEHAGNEHRTVATWLWQPDALTTRLDLIHKYSCSPGTARHTLISFRRKKGFYPLE